MRNVHLRSWSGAFAYFSLQMAHQFADICKESSELKIIHVAIPLSCHEVFV